MTETPIFDSVHEEFLEQGIDFTAIANEPKWDQARVMQQIDRNIAAKRAKPIAKKTRKKP